jgi:hypothetical protein
MLTEQDREDLAGVQEKVLASGRPSQRLMRYVCRDCIYDPLGGGSSRAQIAACAVDSCPLHPLRHLWSS